MSAMAPPKITIKVRKTFRGNEGSGFNADILVEGVKIGTVDNSANGGCYDYAFFDAKGGYLREHPTFEAGFAEWKKTHADKYEDEDSFVNDLIESQNAQSYKAKAAAAGFPVTIILKKGEPYKVGSREVYPDESLTAVRSHADIPAAVKKYKAKAWELVA
jgi:hypothetical protein